MVAHRTEVQQSRVRIQFLPSTTLYRIAQYCGMVSERGRVKNEKKCKNPKIYEIFLFLEYIYIMARIDMYNKKPLG
jgi:hypothetical protein